jgi:hypothetical protein
MSEQPITLRLSSDQALVLFDWLSRFNDATNLRFDHAAEQRVLWDVEAMLESQLLVPLDPEYRNMLMMARDRVSPP